jgi:hypothetical protein
MSSLAFLVPVLVSAYILVISGVKKERRKEGLLIE